MDHAVIERYIGKCRQRLRAFVCAEGGNFEHVL